MKILIVSPIDAETIQKLREQHDVVCAFDAKESTLQSLIQDREVLIFRSGLKVTAEVMQSAPNLKLLLRAGSGIDNLDLEYARQRGLEVVRIPGPGAKAVAEMSFALMLALARRILEADRLTRQGRWAKHELTGYQLSGKVLGIVGAGNIGSQVGRLGAAWGMKVLGCVEHPSPAVAAELAEAGVQLTDFNELLSSADFLSLHVPLKESTRNLINADALARMKRGSYLINLARGGVVDEIALYQALASGHLAGAALDVHAAEGEGKISPLAELPNVILTPHIGAGTYDSQREIGEIVIHTIETYVAKQAAHSHANGHYPGEGFLVIAE
jgi:D-3-phosphoglycerate dehydrogenase / 2-oxoglutarate reductase